jgi:CRISPR-associated protein Csb2
MATLLLRFPARRYHATPWSHHVNEGIIEWPPSPWRLLRALVSVGYTTLHWTEVPATGRRLFERLAGVLPSYRVPRAVAAHSRHYMPIGGLRADGIENTTLVFDTWARIDDGALAIDYGVELPPDEHELLATLAGNLGYLGRSESWVEARLLEPSEAPPEGLEVTPCSETSRPGLRWEQINLMAPEPADAYAGWHRTFTAGAGAANQRGNKAKAKGPFVPEDLVACLHAETGALRAAGWSQPPGTRQVLYWRPTDALEPGSPVAIASRVELASVEVVLLALASATNNLHALPLATRTLPHAERLHRALVSLAIKQGHSSAVIGRSPEGEPLEGHAHAHVLPLDLDADGHLDHVLLWAPMGLDAIAQGAARSVRRTHAKGIGELRVAIVGMGDRDDLLRVRGDWRAALTRVLGPVDGSVEWVSRTPFVPPRFVKSRGRNTIIGQVHAELESRGLPAPISVEVLDPRDSAVPAVGSFRHYVLARGRSDRSPPQRVGLAIRLRFPSPIRGPLCLGYGGHFGLGRFDCIAAPPLR